MLLCSMVALVMFLARVGLNADIRLLRPISMIDPLLISLVNDTTLLVGVHSLLLLDVRRLML